MSISDIQLVANRENARHSTGPRTLAGKQRSSLNALRHGLTSQVVVMPEEDLQAYLKFTERYVKDLSPKTEPEKQMAQDMANTAWRLNRAACIEHGIYAIGQHDFADLNHVDNPEIHAALTAATTFLRHGHHLENLSRQENRLRRSLQQSMKLYHDLQDRRREQERDEIYEAAKISKTHKMQSLPYNPADDGFVLSNDVINQRLSRQQHFEQARLADEVDYDLEKFLTHSAG